MTAKNYTQLDDREESAGREHAATTLAGCMREWILVATKRFRFDGQGDASNYQAIKASCCAQSARTESEDNLPDHDVIYL